MDLSVSSASAAYLQTSGYAQSSGPRGLGGAESQDYAATMANNRQAAAVKAELSPASPEAQKAQEEAVRRKDPSAEVSRSPGFSFEYEDNQRVMKVHNAKGVLIYQVPSKGQLALVSAEESSQLRLTA